VLYPALPGDPGHALWQRDFTGASSLFGVVLRPKPLDAVKTLLDSLTLFGMGASWGGFESLCIPTNPAPIRTATAWEPEGPTLRLHIGLEDPEDLIADLARALDRYTAA
jgi:cystathionine beta-lyase